MNESVNSIKALSISQIKQANSGHPGICLGFSEVMHVLYSKIANVHPTNSKFLDRDRVVLSAGHGSAMLYATLHLSGFEYSIDDLKEFRQMGSNTPGHPEIHLSGVDATTGPLGQGVGNSVGMALGAKRLQERYKNVSDKLFNNYVYCVVGDGCLNEGVSFEALSLASHLNLNNLVVIHDANNITLDGKLDQATSIDEIQYFKSLNFDIFEINDVNDLDLIERTLLSAKNSSRPAYVKVNTIVGRLSKVENSSASHGAPLSDEDFENVMTTLEQNMFEVKQDAYNEYKAMQRKSLIHINEIEHIVRSMEDGEIKTEITKLFNNSLKFKSDKVLHLDTQKVATRDIFDACLTSICSQSDLFFSGSADIFASTKVKMNNRAAVKENDYDHTNLNFGIREFAMGCIVNGLNSYNLKALSSTFLSFVDYMKSSIRVAALSNLNTVYVFSHDSVYVGEDGPTHQPIEQISNLRSIPNVEVIKPLDANETQEVIDYALNNKTNPVVIVTTRQPLNIYNTKFENKFLEGAYYLRQYDDFDYQILSTSSEITNAIDASDILLSKGIKVNVINISSFEILETKPELVKELIKNRSKNIGCELSSDMIWYKYCEKLVNLENFGWSASGIDISKKLDTTNKLVRLIRGK